MTTVDKKETSERRRLARASIIGFVLGGGLFALLGVFMNWKIGDPALSNAGPTTVLGVIGGTVAGLVAPMFSRWRRRHR